MAQYYYTTNYSGPGGRFSLFSPTIKSLLILNVVIFVLENLFFGFLTIGGVPLGWYFDKYFALQPVASDTFYPWWQLITYQFMHGGVMHLLLNMFALWMFGSELDSLWGGRRFLTFYLIAGIGGGMLQLIVSYFLGSSAPTVGASGAINGVMLAFALMFPDRPLLMFPIFFPIPAKIFVFFWLAIDFISGFTSTSNVAHFAHLGGALFGFLMLRYGDRLGVFSAVDRVIDMLSGQHRMIPSGRKIYDIRSAGTPTMRSTSSSWLGERLSAGRHTHLTDISQEEVDRILDKIATSGYNSLSDEEKYILNEASKRL